MHGLEKTPECRDIAAHVSQLQATITCNAAQYQEATGWISCSQSTRGRAAQLRFICKLPFFTMALAMSYCFLISWAKCSGEPGSGMAPCFCKAATTLGAASASVAVLFSFSIISLGVPAGASRP